MRYIKLLLNAIRAQKPTKISCTMENYAKVYFDQFQNDAKLKIQLFYLGKNIEVTRDPEEILSSSLTRLGLNVAKKLKCNHKKKAKANSGCAIVTGGLDDLVAQNKVFLLTQDQVKIDGEMKNKQAWPNGKFLTIKDTYVPILHNPPTVESLELLEAPMTGMLIIPRLKLLNATPDHSKFEWYRQVVRNNDEETSKQILGEDEDNKMEVEAQEFNPDLYDWELIGHDKFYMTNIEDKGRHIKLEILPGNEDECLDGPEYTVIQKVVAVTKGVVINGPEHCLFDDRLNLTKTRTFDGCFRIVCYNILADVYATTDYAQSFLFPYCPEHALSMSYRQQLLCKEIAGYNGDLICLQEVDRWMFEDYLMPIFSHLGYAGCFGLKHQTKEGVAMFYRRDKFRLLKAENIIIKKAIENRELYGDILDKITENRTLYEENLLKRTTVVLICLLQSVDDPTKHILIGNTHLYYHPRACNIRALQVKVILTEIHVRMNKLIEQSEKDNLPRTYTPIVCGDFNSKPHNAAVELLTTGKIANNHADYYSGGKVEFVDDLNLTNDVIYSSACGFPTYTNFVASFQACLDYIFYDKTHLEVNKIIPHPSHESVIEHTALPNETAPSDHIAQVVELKWTVPKT